MDVGTHSLVILGAIHGVHILDILRVPGVSDVGGLVRGDRERVVIQNDSAPGLTQGWLGFCVIEGYHGWPEEAVVVLLHVFKEDLEERLCV